MEVDLFEVKSNNWSTDTLLSAPGFSFYCIEQFDQMTFLNPYILKTRKLGLSEFVVVTTNFDIWLHERYSAIEIDLFYKRLKSSYKKIIALDTFDTFDLGFSNPTISYFDKIIKPQGVYKDKTKYVHGFFSKEDINKIELSFPCFISVIPELRKRVREVKGVARLKNSVLYSLDNLFPQLNPFVYKKNDLNFIGSATNSIRIDIVNKLSSNDKMFFDLFISNFPEFILDSETNKIVKLSSVNRYTELAIDVFSPKLNRYSYLYRMMRSKVLLSPPGYGELAFRHGEAMMLNRLLLCENLDAVNILYNFQNQENCLYYNNIDEIEDIIENIVSNKKKLNEISNNGYETWKVWVSGLDQLYYDAVIKHFS